MAGDARTAAALRARYGDSPWLRVGDQFLADLGLGNQRVGVRQAPLADVPVDEEHIKRTYGRYVPGLNSITMNRANSEDQNLATVAHEIAHAADTLYGKKGEASGKTHHALFKDFDEQLPQLLDEQRFQELLGQGSMKLQHPWQGSRAAPSPWVSKKF